MVNPATAIIVVAYNRPVSLTRLLHSIAQAKYPANTNIPLVISIDGGGDLGDDVRAIAAQFEWEFGEKEIVDHQSNLGLIDHIFSCGDLSQRFGSIILLEDDLMVGRAFYRYALQALSFYEADLQIAGISLSALWFHGFTQLPFTPYPDDGESFFMQIAWYQGQAYTADQWHRFREWLNADGMPVTDSDGMHPVFSRFPSTDWFPLKTRYLVKTGRFYAFPRESLAVNFGETGTHFAKQTSFFQVPVQERKKAWRFQSLTDSVAVYDSWQEMLPDRLIRLAPQLDLIDFETDFYGERDPQRVKAEFLLTSQPSNHAGQDERSWGLVMRPPEANLVQEVPGDDLRLLWPSHLNSGFFARLRADWKRFGYFSRYRPMSRRQKIKLLVGRWFSSQW